jgi:hypothetical protein
MRSDAAPGFATTVNGTNANWSGTLSASGTTTLGGALNQSGGLVSLASTTVVGNVTSTGLTVTSVTNALGLFGSGGALSGYTGSACTNQGVSAISATGTVTCTTFATSTSGGSGSVTTSSAVTAKYFPYWANSTGGLNGTSSAYQASANDLTLASTSDNGLFSIVNASNTVVLQVASTTNNNNILSVGSTASPYLGVTSSGIPLLLGTSTVSLGGSSLALNACTSTVTNVPLVLSTSTELIETEAQTQPGGIGSIDYDSYISGVSAASSSITTQVCGLVAAGVTPTASKYNIFIQRMSGL